MRKKISIFSFFSGVGILDLAFEKNGYNIVFVNEYDTDFMQHLAFQGVYKLISNGVRGNTSDFRSWDKVCDIWIAIPKTRQEQEAICDYLDRQCIAVEEVISTKKQQLEVLATYKKSLIFEYVTGKKEVPLS